MFFGIPLLNGQVTGIDISLSAIPGSASEVIVVVDGNGTSLRNSTATNGATSLVLRTGLPAGNGYRVRVIATRGSGIFPSVVAGGKAAGVNVTANVLTTTAITLSAPSLNLASSNPASVSSGTTFTIAGSITDPANFLDGRTTLRMWTNTGTSPTTNIVGTQNYSYGLTKSGDNYAFSFNLTAPPISTVLYYQIGDNGSAFDRSDGTQAPFLVLPDLSQSDSARNIVIGAGLPPAIVNQPSNQTTIVDGSVNFLVTVTGTAPLSYQWRKNGASISGASSGALTLTDVQLSDAGSYTVVVGNVAGNTTSNAATLTVNVPAAISAQPISQTVNAGTAATFTAAATGTAPLTYQWRKDGTPILGATTATFTLSSVQPTDAAAYTVVISNPAGSSTSNVAILAVTIPNPGRLINLSVLTDIATVGDDFTLGYVVGGSSTSGAKPLVIRAAGPSLGAFGVPGTLDDPKLELFARSTKTSENDNWGGSPQLTAALAAVGAFAYTGPASKDAAATASITTRDNSVRVSAAGSGTGAVIAEIYDATPAASFTTATPRLINVSVRKHLGSGLTMGFVVGGATPAKVLVRGIGPTLGAFGVPGTVVDPQLTLFNSSSVKIGENNDWAGTAELTAAFANVGAFALPATSKDAALLVTLAPGNYTAQVTGVNGTTGVALVEVYEVP